MPKIYELVRTLSLNDSGYESFEYLIRWIGRDGGDYLLMFYDAEVEFNTDGEIINLDTNPEALIKSSGQGITLKADDLSLSDLNVIRQIFENKFITRLFKDGSVERYAPEPNSFTYRLMEGRYEIEIKLRGINIPVWK
jgi:hypothetical protein